MLGVALAVAAVADNDAVDRTGDVARGRGDESNPQRRSRE